MRDLTVLAGVAGSATITDVDEPPDADGSLLVAPSTTWPGDS